MYLSIVIFQILIYSDCLRAHNHNVNNDFHHECVHDEFTKEIKIEVGEQQPSPIEATLTHEKMLRRQHKGLWQKIRILTDYSNITSADEFKNLIVVQFIKRLLVPQAIDFISQTYMVYPKQIINEIIGKTVCGDYKIPSNHSKQGVQNYDLVLYIGIVSTNDEKWLARASACYLDSTTYRPVAGFIQYNAYFIQKGLEKQSISFTSDISNMVWASYVQTSIHEIHHILGFSSVLFQFYVNPNNNSVIGTKAIIKQDNERSWVIIPSMVQQARDYFNCSSAQGLPLEDYGGFNSAGSHWERTTFGNEAMTATDFPGAVFSSFTLSFMENTGWYYVNQNLAQTFIWGKGEGCQILQGECPSNLTEFCDSTQKRGCSNDFMGEATCWDSDPYAEGCSYWKEDIKHDCRSLQLGRTTYTGYGTRCWLLESSIIDLYTDCLKSSCENKKITIQIDFRNYTCSEKGQRLEFIKNNLYGYLTCPDIDQFCAYDNDCLGDCSGEGTCQSKKCKCYAGFTGADCRDKTKPIG